MNGNESGTERKRLRWQAAQAAITVIGRLELPIIILLAGASGYYTYHGALELNTDISVGGFAWSVREHALVVAVAATLALFFIMIAMMRVFPELDVVRLNLFGWPLLALIVATVLGISSYFNLTGMIGSSALLDDMQDQLPAIVHDANQMITRVAADQVYVSALQNLAKFYRDQADNEARFGVLSGQRNGGPVYGTLVGLADSFAVAAKTAASHYETMTQITDTFEPIISSMSLARLPYEAASIKQRQREFYGAAEQIRSDIVKGVRIDVVQDMAVMFANVKRDQATIRNTGYQISPQQQHALEGIYNDLEQKRATYLPPTLLQERERSNRGLLARLETPLAVPTVYAATWRYKFRYVPFLVAAILLDTAIIPVMLMKMLARWQVLADSEDFSVLDRISAAELQTIQRALLPPSAAPPPSPPPPPSAASPPVERDDKATRSTPPSGEPNVDGPSNADQS